MPNPGSDINIVARIFREIYPDLKDRSTFGLDDMTRSMIDHNLVTSQGALGEEALKRSTRPDRSRDPLYNQSKMYAEVYRLLGLIKSAESALAFRFSLLGRHFATASDYAPLLKECFLGLAYPHPGVDVRNDQRVRLFLCILRVMRVLDGRVSRDEVILGPMSVRNDRDNQEFQNLVRHLRELRRTPGDTDRAIDELSREIGINPETMRNYTRIPIGVLLWTGWAVKEREYFRLSDAGESELKFADEARDIRIDDFSELDMRFRVPLVRVSFYEMLGRAGFDLGPVWSQVEDDRKMLVSAGFSPNQRILFSPFQQLNNQTLSEAFGEEQRLTTTGIQPLEVSTVTPRRPMPVSRITLRQTAPITDAAATGTDEARRVLEDTLKTFRNDESKTIDTIHRKFGMAGKSEFYPLVTALFNIAGFQCQLTRAGVNPLRADASIVLKDDTIPIEIKSPSEEMEISVKAVRQAVENKIVFLSRKMFPCNPKTTTLVVGFNPPNPRSEVHDLIEDINKCFDIHVGIFDFRNLIALAIAKLTKGFTMDTEALKALVGLAIVESA